MAYSVAILPRAQKELAQIPQSAFTRTIAAIRALAQNPRPPGYIKLTNRPGWRIRVGEYRVVYNIDDLAQTVTVVHVAHRRDVYRA
jgi:mRNA interferase RelE/StbE